MTSQELKQYINDKLGNSVRCLLPSYWWKRLLGLVVDKIDDAIPNVTSEEKLNGLDSKIGSLATVSYKNNAVISPSQCYQITEAEFESIENNDTAHGIDLTTIYGVEFPSVIPSVEKTLLFCFFKDGVLLEGHIVIQNSVNVYYYDATGQYVLYDDSGFLINEAVEYINALFKDGVQYGAVIDGSEGLYSDYDTIDKVVKFIVEVYASDAYIKNQDGWDKLAKENEIKSQLEDIPNINFVDFYDAQSNYGFTIDGWEKMKESITNPSIDVDLAQSIVDEYMESNRQLFITLKKIKRPLVATISGFSFFANLLQSETDIYSGGVVQIASVSYDDKFEVYITPISDSPDISLIRYNSNAYRVLQLMETGEVKVLYRTPYEFHLTTSSSSSTALKSNKAFVKLWFEALAEDPDVVGAPLPTRLIYCYGRPGLRMLSTDFTSEKFTGTFLEGLELKQVEISGETGETTITTLGTFATVTE